MLNHWFALPKIDCDYAPDYVCTIIHFTYNNIFQHCICVLNIDCAITNFLNYLKHSRSLSHSNYESYIQPHTTCIYNFDVLNHEENCNIDFLAQLSSSYFSVSRALLINYNKTYFRPGNHSNFHMPACRYECTVGFQCQAIHKKFLRRFNTILAQNDGKKLSRKKIF